MSWKSLTVPLVVIVVGMVMIVLALATPDRRPATGAGDRSVAAQDDPPCSSYPASDLPPRCVTTTPQPTDASAYPDQTTATVTSTTPETATTTVTTTTTTITPQAAPPTVAAAQPTASTAPPEDALPPDETEAAPEAVGPEATPANVLTCAPGERIVITGQGPPRAPFLLHFGQRVVGGGSVSVTGSFSIPLVIGRERPGTYPVIVQVRGSEQVLRELTCEVPPAAPPTPV